MSDTQILFSGQEVDLTFVQRPGRVCMVTFTAMGGPKGHGRGFGHNFLAKNGVSALHVRSLRNHWYQPGEVRDAVAVARRKLDEIGYEDVIVYGASMGAYGAAAHSKAVGATRGILIAPQYTIDPAKMPDEKRWRREAAEIRFVFDDMPAQISRTARLSLLADPNSEDRPHIANYLAFPNVDLVPVLFGGHIPGAMLVEAGLMSKTMLDLIHDRFDRVDFFRRMHGARRNSSTYWRELSRLAAERGRPQLATHANNEAIKRSKSSVGLMHQKFHLLLRSGELEEALRVANETVEMDKAHPASWRNLSVVALRSGDVPLALKAGEAAVRNRPNDPDLHRVRLVALMRAEQWPQALETGLRAAELDPGYAQTHADLSRIHLALGDNRKAWLSLQKAIGLDGTKEKWKADLKTIPV